VKKDYTESNIALDILSSINLELDDSDNLISDLIKNKLIVPYIYTRIPKGFYVYRARSNTDGESFTKKKEISYNTQLCKIGLGRANRKGQSIFYASHKWDTPIFETSSMIKEGIKNGKETFTIGRWFVRESFLLIVLIPKLAIIDEHVEIIN